MVLNERNFLNSYQKAYHHIILHHIVKKPFYGESGQTLEQVVLRGCGISVLEGYSKPDQTPF